MASSARIDELQKKFDENPRRYFAPLANEYRKAGDLERAIQICQEYLPQQPGHMSGHIVYGQALFELDRLDESRQVFETALSLDPENLIALRHLGDIARRVGDSRTARSWYQRVLEADPRNEEIAQIMMTLLSTPSVAQPGINSSSDTPGLAAPAQAASEEPAGFEPTGLGDAQPDDRSGFSVGPELAALPERQAESPEWTPPPPLIPEEELLDLNDFDFSVGGVRLSELGATPSIDQPPVEEAARQAEPSSNVFGEAESEEEFTETAAFITAVEPEIAVEAPTVVEIESSAIAAHDVETHAAPDSLADAVTDPVVADEPVFEADPFAIAAAPATEEPIVETVDVPPVETVESFSANVASSDSIPGLESFEHGVSAPEETSSALEFEEFFIAAPAASEPPVAEAESLFDVPADPFVETPAYSVAESVADPFPETIVVADEAAMTPVEEPSVVDDSVVDAAAPVVLESADAPAIESFDGAVVESVESVETTEIESFEMPPLESLSGEAFDVSSLEASEEAIASESASEPFVASDLEIETAPDVDWLTPVAQAPAVDEIVAATAEPEWQSNATTWDTPLATPAVSEPELAPAEAFVTETMAELYLQQGHLDAALDIYKKLVEQRPGEPQLVERLRILQEQFFGRPTPIVSPAVVEPPPPPPVNVGPTIREFLFGIIAARATSATSEADESANDADTMNAAATDAVAGPVATEPASIEEEFGELSEPLPQPVAHMSSTPTSIPVVDAALEAVIDFSEQPMVVAEETFEIPSEPTPQPAAAVRTPAMPAETVRGSIDALFSNATETADDSQAANSLVQAFTPAAPETDPLQGMPAHKASNELSLDHVFKPTQVVRTDGETEGFSFDQFFADELAEGTNKSGSQAPSAPRQGAEDIAQFNNWLNGLKKT